MSARLWPWLRQPAVGLSAVACLATLGYLWASQAGGFLGFPLDDAWIHQTYARNLALRGEFAFLPGQPSAGSTSPAWTFLLALGYWLRIDFRVWAYALGAALLSVNAWLAYRLVLRYWPGARGVAWAAGLFVAVEWHLVWAAASGMETLLFSALVLLAFALDPMRHSGWLGLVLGTSLLVRPDGLLLLPVVLVRVLLVRAGALEKALRLLAGFAVVCVPYLAFNQWLAGSPWPNTFYAKQAEYAVLQAVPLIERLGQVGMLPFVGAQALLLPGLAWLAGHTLRARRWDLVLPLLWIGAMIGAYAVRLPVTYQHGRYLIPVIPLMVALGTAGLARILQGQSRQMLVRVGSRAWTAAIVLLAVVFGLLGAQAYTRDVQIIETEMVAMAHWVRANTQPQARVAAHDIGALGYYAQRELLDLAGLVTPDVIPFMRDEARLAAWLDGAGADYLVTFPDWYPVLVEKAGGGLSYQTEAPFSVAAGGENMAIYRWKAVLP